jgi:hypothetical protein
MTSVVKIVKPAVSFNKTSYANIVEYISVNADPAIASAMLDLLKDALLETVGFDPDVKIDPAVSKRQAEKQKKRLDEAGITKYDKYDKPRYENLKAAHPGILPSVLVKMTKRDLLAT